jgi:hypothetical protein
MDELREALFGSTQGGSKAVPTPAATTGATGRAKSGKSGPLHLPSLKAT